MYCHQQGRTTIHQYPNCYTARSTIWYCHPNEFNEDGRKQNVLHLDEGLTTAGYLIITNKRECNVYLLNSGPIFLPGNEMKNAVTTKSGALIYFVFKIVPNMTFPSEMINMDAIRKLLGAGHEPKLVNFKNVLKDE